MLEIVLAFTIHALPGEWNETHPGIRYENAPYVAALFLNSEDNPSLALGLVGRADPFFGEIGLATGYSAAPVVPFARAGVEYGRMRLFVAPAVTTDGEVGFVAGAEIVAVRF